MKHQTPTNQLFGCTKVGMERCLMPLFTMRILGGMLFFFFLVVIFMGGVVLTLILSPNNFFHLSFLFILTLFILFFFVFLENKQNWREILFLFNA